MTKFIDGPIEHLQNNQNLRNLSENKLHNVYIIDGQIYTGFKL